MSARALALLALLLGACAALPPSRGLEEQRERERELRARPDFVVRGRIAVRRGDGGASAHFLWREEGGMRELWLRPPAAGGGLRLSEDARGARLEGLEGGALAGRDGGRLLGRVFGAPVPLAALVWWLRGARAPGSPARVRVADGLPAEIRQGGWRIRYGEWLPGAPPMPRRIEAERGSVRLRVVITAWGAP